MQENQPENSPPGLGLDDVVYALYKHRRMIVILAVAGFIAAVGVKLFSVPLYESSAKLLVRYVMDRTSALDSVESNESSGFVHAGRGVIAAELEILTSWDLATTVAENLQSAELPGAAGAENVVAPVEVLSGLDVEASPHGNVIEVTYGHRDPEVAVRVLRELVNEYFEKHLDIHRSVGAFDFVSQQTDQVRTRLRETEDELKTLKAEAGIISFDESMASLSARMVTVRQDLMEAETEMAEQKASLQAMKGLATGARPDAAGDNEPVETAAQPGPEVVREFETLTTLLDRLREKKYALLLRYTPENHLVISNQRQIDESEEQRRALIEAYPGLGASTGSAGDFFSEQARLAAIEARIDSLRSQYAGLKEEAVRLAGYEAQIANLERKKGLDEEKYQYFESTLDKARIDEALDPTKIPNISIVQRPSVAAKAVNDRTKKIVLGLAGGGLMAGIGLAMFIELFLDRRIKRPLELVRLRVPMMLSIPCHEENDRPRLPGGAGELPEGHKNGKEITPALAQVNGSAVSPWEDVHFIRPYSDAIRDRLGYYFEINNMTHKPKLVALTSFSQGAGTSTLAASLAASFSETDDGKVLLVDMNVGGAEVHPFFEGKPACRLTEAVGTGEDIWFKPAEKNLYLATAASRDDESRQFVPKKLYDLMPQFKASDFDYIIFDMPPLGPTSPTMAMAGVMDKFLLVVDGENNNRYDVKRSYDELVAAKADVSCIMNKTPEYLPEWLQRRL